MEPRVISPVSRSLKVLLVEDSPVLTDRLTEAICQIDGIELIGITDTEAMAVDVTSQKDVDVILLDLHLKQGTGFGVMRALAAAHPKPAIIVLTNYDLPEYENAAVALGASFFLDKSRDYWRIGDILRGLANKNLAVH